MTSAGYIIVMKDHDEYADEDMMMILMAIMMKINTMISGAPLVQPLDEHLIISS